MLLTAPKESDVRIRRDALERWSIEVVLRVLAGMKHPSGRVVIRDFYDSVEPLPTQNIDTGAGL